MGLGILLIWKTLDWTLGRSFKIHNVEPRKRY